MEGGPCVRVVPARNVIETRTAYYYTIIVLSFRFRGERIYAPYMADGR